MSLWTKFGKKFWTGFRLDSPKRFRKRLEKKFRKKFPKTASQPTWPLSRKKCTRTHQSPLSRPPFARVNSIPPPLTSTALPLAPTSSKYPDFKSSR